MTKTKWTKIGNLEWSEVLGKMDWEYAKKKCEKLGGRLPTRLELSELVDRYDNPLKMSDYYWSSTEFTSYSAYCVYFDNGLACSYGKPYFVLVRCVRPIKN